MIHNVYGFDDDGKKIKIGEYDDGLLPVGGRIFYIDSNSDETVEFYDAQGNVLSNVAVGDAPSYYKVTSAGVSGKEKFYVYYPNVYTNLYWTYMDNNYAYKYELLEAFYNSLGAGKRNTSIVMSKDDGAYISDFNNRKTIWKQIQEARDNELGGCSDWYLPCQNEFQILKSIVPDDFNIWNQWSNESDSQNAAQWNPNYDSWRGVNKGSGGNIVMIRNF